MGELNIKITDLILAKPLLYFWDVEEVIDYEFFNAPAIEIRNKCLK